MSSISSTSDGGGADCSSRVAATNTKATVRNKSQLGSWAMRKRTTGGRDFPGVFRRVIGNCVFRGKSSTNSNRSHPVIPVESIRRFQREGSQFLARTGIGGGQDGI